MKKHVKSRRFLLLFFLMFLLGEGALRQFDPMGTLAWFPKNDFEKILLSEGANTFDKGFYGNSVVISAFIQEESESGYVNLGLDYGSVSDLAEMLRRGLIEIESELVLGVNYFTFYDDMDTNPTYPWFQRFYEPYIYFQRDRLYSLITDGMQNLLKGESFAARYENLGRSVYYGTLEGDAWAENLARHRENYWSLPIEAFEENLAALDSLASYCREEDIRLRVLWMPWNPEVAVPLIVYDVMARANELLEKYQVEILDGLNSLPAEYFHDSAHLEYTEGAPYFTRWIDAWLMQ